jgi:hypothetical protein
MNFWHLLAACQAVWFLVASARRDVELEPIATAFLPRLLRVALALPLLTSPTRHGLRPRAPEPAA